MKKIITITTLLAAGTLFASAETITLPESSDFTWILGGNASGIADSSVTESIMKSLITAMGDDKVGWFGGTGQNHSESDGTYGYGADILITSSTSFMFTSRPKLSGDYIALGLNLDKVAESITLNFSADNKIGYSLWSYDADADKVSQLIACTYFDGTAENKSVSATYNTAEVCADKIFVLWTSNHADGKASGGTNINVSDISLGYVAPVPEPSAFGLLAGLGALALAGTRRRRRK